ncbi:SMI1/KNR4 family protein [Actinomadura sp. WAC 06369]|uniref:SMI1/KNR4 family protein n=1 Tax=Actinomadura sp. WAC 06369 TaxID=2203193 RepID=UPI0013159A4D|nr:SMI1/KNR4 family protein [Actinomadura sp. WAC 06369]
MDHEQLAETVLRAKHATALDLRCPVPGHPDGHECFPVPGDVDGLVKELTRKCAGPYTAVHGLPPLSFDGGHDWTHAWLWASRAVAVGRDPDGRPAVAVVERSLTRPDDLPADMPWLDRLIAITDGAPAPVPPPDWASVEKRLGTPLPGDYKRLVETFGCDGLFDEFFHVFDTEELISYWEYFAGDDPASGGLPGWPLPGGLIPWSSNEHHETFWWIAEGPDPDRWPVYAVTELDEGTRFDCTATEFLFRQMTDPDFPFHSPADHITGHWFSAFVRSDS